MSEARVETCMDALIAGDVARMAALFDTTPSLDTPLWGRADDGSALARMVGAAASWLDRHQARFSAHQRTDSVERVVLEGILKLEHDLRSVELPIAVAGDLAGQRYTAVRIYHSLFPLLGRHRIRPPLLPAADHVPISGAVGCYQHALAAGHLDELLAQFAPEGYAREPSGADYVHRGPQGLRRFYAALLGNGGGVALHHCTVTDDGARCAIEYFADRWGRTTIPPQAGVAVYERSTSGLLRAARIYDDIDPPLTGD